MRSSMLTVRVDRETKEQSEAILQHLGLTASEAVTIFLRQVILQKGLPFSVCDTRYGDADDSTEKPRKGRFYAEIENFD